MAISKLVPHSNSSYNNASSYYKSSSVNTEKHRGYTSFQNRHSDSSQQNDIFIKGHGERKFGNQIHMQNLPPRLIQTQDRYRAQRYSKDSFRCKTSNLLYSAQPGDIQLCNKNENFNPYSRGICLKLAPFLKSEPKYRTFNKDSAKVAMKTLVLDIDETLVHSNFKPVENANVVISIGKDNIYVMYRPGALEFIEKMSKMYELVFFTASMEKYAQPLVEYLDPKKLCTQLLCRDYCTQLDGTFVKDLSKLGRDLENVILLDNSPNSYILQKENGLSISSWYDDQTDKELYKYAEILQLLANAKDVRKCLNEVPKIITGDKIDPSKSEIISQEIIDIPNNKTMTENEQIPLSYFESPKENECIIIRPYSSCETKSVDPHHKSQSLKCYPDKEKHSEFIKDPAAFIRSYFDKSNEDKYTDLNKDQNSSSHNKLVDIAYNRKQEYSANIQQINYNILSEKNNIGYRSKTAKNTSRTSSSYKVDDNSKEIKDNSDKNIMKATFYPISKPESKESGFISTLNDHSTRNNFKYNSMNYSNIRATHIRNESMQRKVDRIRNNNYDVSIISRRLGGALEASSNKSYRSNLHCIKQQATIHSKVDYQERMHRRSIAPEITSSYKHTLLRNMNNSKPEYKRKIGGKYI